MSKKSNHLSRRGFLKAATIGAGAIAAPWVWIPKTAFAVSPAFGKAKHVIVFFAGGGMRTSGVFNGDVAKQFNPYGILNTKADWGVSSLFSTEPVELTTWGPGDVVPSFPDIAHEVAMLGAVDHAPGYMGGGITSHNTTPLRMATGYPGGLNSFFSHVGQWKAATSEKYIPPFVVGNQARTFAMGVGEQALYRAVTLSGPGDFSQLTGDFDADDSGLSWNSELEKALDTSFMDSRPYHVRQKVKGTMQAKDDAMEFLETFLDPALHLTTQPDAGIGGITNEQLLEVFPDMHWCQRAAMAVRLLQIGSPIVAVGQGGYDNHSNEEMSLRPKIESMGRALSGLKFVLQRLDHPEGGKYWDHTVIYACTEFGRDGTYADTGLNNGGGTDHQGSPASRNQSCPVMGGPVTAGGKLIAPTDPMSYTAIDGNAVHSQSLLSTALDVLGIKSDQFLEQPPIHELFEV